MARRLRAFASNAHGSVGIIFALSITPMIGLVGLGIDFGRTMATKATLDAAADAAALAAATEAEATLQSPYGNGQSGIAAAIMAGTVAGTSVFSANAEKVGGQIGGAPKPKIVLTVNGMVIQATASYAAQVPTVFGQLFGVPAMQISDAAKSSLTLPAYLNISVGIDISQSMGLASTAAGMAKLQTLTPDQCAFGCHVVAAAQNSGLPYEQIAHNNSVQLRIDVIKDSTKQMISTAQTLQGSSGMISFGLYALQGGPGAAFQTIAPSSSNYSSLLAAADTIDLGTNTSAGVGDTDLGGAMPSLTATVPPSGTGATASSAQQFVFLMTDGVQDVAGSCTDGHCTQAFDPSLCAALKAKGVTVGVIYTTYLQMNNDQRFIDLVQPFWNTIPTNLMSCASSPGWFYQASDASDIQLAINALFAKATSRGVLTQ